MSAIQIGGHYLECGKDPYIICAIDNNFSEFNDMKESINQAKIVGADAVKFSMYDYDSLYGIPKTKKTLYEEKYEVSEEMIAPLKAHCDKIGIDFLVSVFAPEKVRSIDPHVNAHHITSREIGYVPLLRELYRIRKPVFMHVGCATATEISFALSILDTTPVILMYGVESTPEAAQFIDITLIDSLKKLGSHVGFFDKSLDPVYLPYAAVTYHGACVVEKHMNAIQGVTPDHKFSLTPADFKTMVDKIRGKSRGLLGCKGPETNMLLKHKRRLVATSLVRQGETLRFNKNFGMYSLLKPEREGMHAIEYLEVDGKKANKDLEIGAAIAASDID
jgi:N,N'-diacetyllegionaminate synthase